MLLVIIFTVAIVVLFVIIANHGKYSEQVRTERREEEAEYLDRAVALNIPIYSIIVFSDRCSLEYLPDSFDDIYICQMSTLRDTINEIFDENPACVPSLVLSTVYSRLKQYVNPSEEVIRKHKEYVRSKK